MLAAALVATGTPGAAAELEHAAVPARETGDRFPEATALAALAGYAGILARPAAVTRDVSAT